MSLASFRITLVQTRPEFGDVEGNVERAIAQARRALRTTGGSDLVIFPELFHTGYVFESRAELRRLAEDAQGGATVAALHRFTRECRTTVVAGLCERQGKDFYNSAVWVLPAGVAGVYRKVHLFDEEKRWFTPGRVAWPIFRVGAVRVGILICFDWRFPEAARSLALRGADILAHPSNLVLPHCQEAMRTRALENGVFCATANRVGEDRRRHRRVAFTGRSQVVDPGGEVLVRAARSRCAVVSVLLDVRRARDKRVTARNHLLADRNPALYGALTEEAGGSSE